MKSGLIDIKKLYFGELPITSKNMYIGNTPVIPEPGPEPSLTYFYYENADENEITLKVENETLVNKQAFEYSRDMKSWLSLPYIYHPEETKEVELLTLLNNRCMFFWVRANTTAVETNNQYWNPETCSLYYKTDGQPNIADRENLPTIQYVDVSMVSGNYTYYLYVLPMITASNYNTYAQTNLMYIASYNPSYKEDAFIGNRRADSMTFLNIFQYLSPTTALSWPVRLGYTQPNANFGRGTASTGITEEQLDGKTMVATIPAYTEAIEVNIGVGQKLYLRNKTGQESTNYGKHYVTYKFIALSGKYNIGGNINTIYDYTDPDKETTYEDQYYALFKGDKNIISAKELILPATLAGYCCCYMFYGCTGLTTVPELPATTLAEYCYSGMFNGCTSLVNAPELPATTLASYCYSSMFSGCTNLTTAPELPATTLASYCYSSMFSGCTNLTTAPELPATTLASWCYNEMFRGCTSLVNAPELPATTLSDSCYSSMFSGCTNLTTAPELPATTLSYNCYSRMFSGCTSLTTAPELPATTLSDNCYSRMFSGCTSLTTAPELPATTLGAYCYEYMFDGCSNLTTAPELPATTVRVESYQYMFAGCASLVNAPVLPATTLGAYCYYYMFLNCISLVNGPDILATTYYTGAFLYMFIGCEKLNNVTTHLKSWSTPNFDRWLSGVASSGTLYNLGGANIPTGNVSGCPSGWTVKTTKDAA